jgi:hypothetical protein
MLNYKKLMLNNPTKLGEMVNSNNQLIEFYEHPLQGDAYPVICVSHSLELAANSEFYDLNDMEAEHGEYEPLFIDGKFQIGK